MLFIFHWGQHRICMTVLGVYHCDHISSAYPGAGDIASSSDVLFNLHFHGTIVFFVEIFLFLDSQVFRFSRSYCEWYCFHIFLSLTSQYITDTNAIELHVLILHPTTFLKIVINSKVILVKFFGLSMQSVILFENSYNFSSSFEIYIPFISFLT